MAPNSVNSEILDNMDKINDMPAKAAPWNYKIMYRGIFSMIFFHLGTIYGIYLLSSAKIGTILFSFIIYILANIGVTAGAHRLWSHRAYKAKLPLQIILMLFQSLSFQFTVITWAKNHRLHHKYSETDADPYNASRGFFFSHMGWMMVYAHDEAQKQMKIIDMSDLTSNPILKFQKKYAYPLIGTMCFVLPTVVPMLVWGETFNVAFHINILRYILNLHAILLVNSVAYRFGNKPYDTNIMPTENNFVSLLVCGEGFHNYHHTFPWDYRAAELGNSYLNLSKVFIDLCAYFGWAYDLKTVDDKIVRARAIRTGDGTYCKVMKTVSE